MHTIMKVYENVDNAFEMYISHCTCIKHYQESWNNMKHTCHTLQPPNGYTIVCMMRTITCGRGTILRVWFTGVHYLESILY